MKAITLGLITALSLTALGGCASASASDEDIDTAPNRVADESRELDLQTKTTCKRLLYLCTIQDDPKNHWCNEWLSRC
jgi:hypothetical protein